VGQAQLQQYPALLGIELIGHDEPESVVVQLYAPLDIATADASRAHHDHTGLDRIRQGGHDRPRHISIADSRNHDATRAQRNAGSHQVGLHAGVRVQDIHPWHAALSKGGKARLRGVQSLRPTEITDAPQSRRAEQSRSR